VSSSPRFASLSVKFNLVIGISLLTFSDPGSENNGIANAQSTIRQWLDPSLENSLQHRWLFKHGNIKSEIAWSQIRAAFSPGFEDILQAGIRDRLIDFNNASPVET
jgi:hypothetical protein